MTARDTIFAGRDGARVAVPKVELAQLASRLDGPLLYPGEAGWDEAILIWNAMVAKVPALVAQPTSARDVAALVDFARERGLLLGIKGGGHNIAGTSIAADGLTIDLSRMRDVVVDPATARAHVGAGCLLRDVDAATQAHGLATVLGFLSEVGVAGLTLGGGLGYLTRRFGWTVDNLEEVEIVTADGQARIANREQSPDLFWALRGAGHNFGVVTRFTFRLHPVGPTVYGGLIAWPFARAEEVLATYRRVTAEAPRELAAWLMFLDGPPAPFVPKEWQGERLAAMSICYSGELEEADEVLRPLRAALGDPVVDTLGERPYVVQQSFLDETEPKGQHYYWKTEYASELSDGLVDTVRELAAEMPIPLGEVGILHLGGALEERDPDDGAVGNRDARFAIGVLGAWTDGEPEADRFRQWVRDAGERIAAFSTGASYINFQTADESDARVRATYGANFERLAELKRRYDPDNLFRVNRNIARATASEPAERVRERGHP